MKLLEGCPATQLPLVERFVTSLVAREVAGLPKGVYLTATQEAKKNGLKVRKGDVKGLSAKNDTLVMLVTVLVIARKSI